MKIIWITPGPVSGLYDNSIHESGSWIDAAYYACKDYDEIELHLISFGADIDTIQEYHNGRHTGYIIPFKTKEQSIKKLKSTIQPDIVQIWGSEHWYGLFAVEMFPDVPKVVFIQGVANNLAKYYFAGIKTTDRIKYVSIKDLYRRNWIDAQQRKMRKTARQEAKVLQSCQGAIIENNWCEDQIHAIAPECKTFRSLLPIKDVFFHSSWNIQNIERHSIFTNAGGYPIKGHHTLFEAMHYVVRKYPDTKLYIPGFTRLSPGFKNWLRRSSYENLLADIVKRYGLENNIIYTGTLSSEQMAQHIESCNVYAMPSWVENHSSSLIEALVVGAPCVSSYAGGVCTLTQNGVNALTYNPQDVECLAGNIIRVFENDDLAVKLSDNAKKIRPARKSNIGDDYLYIYRHLLS